MQRPLRILIVVDLVWDARLGAVRVFMALADAWRAAGHQVTKHCLSDAFPRQTRSRVIAALRHVIFPRKAAAFVRRHAAEFDVIDSLLGTLPLSKQRLRFDGLLVARSVGLYRLYRKFERWAVERWPDQPRGKLLGRVFYRFVKHRLFRASEEAVRHCDLLNLPNETEVDALRPGVGSNKPAIVLPYGLTAHQRRALREAAAPAKERRALRKIAFVGMWSPRKGAKDFGQIIQRVRQSVPDARFIFLGTLVQDRQLLSDLDLPKNPSVELVAEYQREELPKLLAEVAVGAFPSYAEGFGLAVLEQLAAGIPTVAYDAAGPRAILRARIPELVVAVGDIDAFAAALIRILTCDITEYERLRDRSLAVAERFDWDEIAARTIAAYRARLVG
ncbi:MAG TPA: glycosyltransferase family 4 protein [Chthoniobacterales bacterium]|nr:glycosyltransferase family 4 protein [Chthoniobacterales bacterium]